VSAEGKKLKNTALKSSTAHICWNVTCTNLMLLTKWKFLKLLNIMLLKYVH